MKPRPRIVEVAKRVVANNALGHRWFAWWHGIGRGYTRRRAWIIGSIGAPRWVPEQQPRTR